MKQRELRRSFYLLRKFLNERRVFGTDSEQGNHDSPQTVRIFNRAETLVHKIQQVLEGFVLQELKQSKMNEMSKSQRKRSPMGNVSQQQNGAHHVL